MAGAETSRIIRVVVKWFFDQYNLFEGWVNRRATFLPEKYDFSLFVPSSPFLFITVVVCTGLLWQLTGTRNL
jgi:hypothetical protein